MAALVEILLPVIPGKETAYRDVRILLSEKFGGVTLHANAPAEGLWKNGVVTEKDQIIIVEVMVDEIDRDWWRHYRKDLEVAFQQEAIVIRTTSIERL